MQSLEFKAPHDGVRSIQIFKIQLRCSLESKMDQMVIPALVVAAFIGFGSHVETMHKEIDPRFAIDP